MPDEQPQKQTKKSNRGFFKLFRSRFKDEPQTREEIVALLRSSLRKGLLDADALAMMEGALHVSELRASDLMVQRAQIEAVDLSEKKENWLDTHAFRLSTVTSTPSKASCMPRTF